MVCQCCGKKKETRMGFCFACVEAEAIIASGLDMYDKGPDGKEFAAQTALEKLKMLVLKGWTKN